MRPAEDPTGDLAVIEKAQQAEIHQPINNFG